MTRPAEHCVRAGPTGGGACGTAVPFRDEPVSMFVRVDRMGLPAVATALLPSAERNAYNDAAPTDDAMLVFAGAELGTFATLHAALDDDLVTVGLTPCSMTMTRALPIGPGGAELPVPLCAAQLVGPGAVSVASLLWPDTLRIDPAAPSGFPNGRDLDDPVIDITLAVILLDLESPAGCGGAGCRATTLAELPLNPPANDEPFLPEFPYLAAAHAP